jgi:hypothetical protein
MNTRCSKEYRYIFTTTWKQASTLHLSSRLTNNESGKLLIIFILSYLFVLPTSFLRILKTHKRTSLQVWMQMYFTFVLFVNQHFPGLPASGTHCTTRGVIERSWKSLALITHDYLGWSRWIGLVRAQHNYRTDSDIMYRMPVVACNIQNACCSVYRNCIHSARARGCYTSIFTALGCVWNFLFWFILFFITWIALNLFAQRYYVCQYIPGLFLLPCS